MRKYVACLIFVFVFGATANAQTAQATLQGLVVDPAHSAVPQAAVTVTNLETGVAKQTSTNAEGRFILPYLLPGEYDVSVQMKGFQRYEQRGIKLDVQQNLSMEITLTLGDVATTVEVAANAAQLDTATSAVAMTMGNKPVTDLPIIGRNPVTLSYLVPGVLPPQGSAGSTGSYGPAISGGRDASGDVRVDGVSMMLPDANNGALQMGGSMPNIDAIAEFTVVLNTLSAEYGRTGGGVFLMATKSGTNTVHGTAYDFFRNNNLNANDFFSNAAGKKLGASNSNQFGFSLGGPVYLGKVYNGRNRTFFFADYQGTRQKSPSIYVGTVPLDAWKAGDFSTLRTASGSSIVIYDPTTTSTQPNAQGNYTRQAFPGNIIPASRMDPVGVKMLTYYPEPNATALNPYTQVNNYYQSQMQLESDDNFTARVDHTFGNDFRSFWRVTKYAQTVDPPNVFGNPGSPLGRGEQKFPRDSFSWDNTYTMNSSTVFSLTYGLARFFETIVPPSAGFDLTSLGFPSYVESQAANDRYTRFPNVSVQGLTGLGQQNSAGIRFVPTSHNLSGSMTKALSKHTIKAGVEYRKFFLNFWQESQMAGSFSYSPTWTQQNPVSAVSTQGFGLASLLLGLGSGSQANAPAMALASSYWAGYVQDDYHVSRRLTLNLGLRYEVDIPKTERYNRMSYWDPTASSPIANQVPGFPNLRGVMDFVTPDNRSQVSTDTNNFSPRFGFAYQLGAKMVVRGGYAFMYAPSIAQATYGNGGFQGFRCTTSMVTSLDGRTPLNYLRNPFPSGYCATAGATPGPYSGPNTSLGQAINESWFPASMNPDVQEWSLNLQRELPGKLVGEIGYVANKGNHLIDGGTSAYNQLPPSDFSLGNTLSDQVPNPFYGIITDPTSTLSLPTVTRAQLLAPYPQYTAVNSIARPTGNSIYHSMVVRLERRFTNGVGFLVAYTAGKGITDSGWGNSLTSINSATARQNIYDRKSDRALDPDDVSSRLVVSFNAELPFGRGHHFLNHAAVPVDLLLGGWQVNGIWTLQSGLPVVLFSSVNQTGLGSAAQRPNNNGHSANLTGQTKDQQIAHWFDPSVFSVAAPFTFGNAPTVLPDVRNPGIRDFDLSLFKNFTVLPENRLKAQLRLEAANALNTTQFGRPGSTVGTASDGVISSVGVNPRSVQLALKLLF